MKNRTFKFPVLLLLTAALAVIQYYVAANVFPIRTSPLPDSKEPFVTPSDNTPVYITPSDVSSADIPLSFSDISSADISASDNTPDTTVSSTPIELDMNQYAVVCVKSGAMRAKKSTDSTLIRYLTKGKKVIVLSTEKEWYKVDYNGTVGWMYSSCLELERNPALEAVLFDPIPEPIPGQVQSLSGTATEKYIKLIAKEHSVVGLSIAVIKDGDVAYHYEYGYSVKSDKRKVTVNTKFRIASLSKVFTSMMAVKLAEDGKLDLNAHIGDILGLSVKNPKHPNSVISTKMLLTHSASFIDKSTIFSSSLKKDFNNKYSYTSAEPGTKHYYTNFGMGVAGAVVETASGQYLTDYAQTAFFNPMGIDAGFDGTKLKDTSDVADCMMRGTVDKSAKEILKAKETNEIGRNYSISAGGLLINAVDMAKVTSILVNNGVYNGKRYLSEETMKEFHTPQIKAKKFQQCIGIRQSDTILPDRTMYYHTGAAYGIFSLMAYDLEDKSGVVILSTGSLDYSDDNDIRTICSETMELIYQDILN